jgi:hypothetical protein
MFRAYLTTEFGSVLNWSLTESENVLEAHAAFSELLAWKFLDGHPFLIWAASGGNYLACHWCRSRPGDAGYLRDKLVIVDWMRHRSSMH